MLFYPSLFRSILHIGRSRTKAIFQLYEYPFHQRTIVFSFLFFHLLYYFNVKILHIYHIA